jgi:stage II sporulation protein D
MKGRLRALGSVLFVAVLGPSLAQSPKPSPQPRATLRIGLWTLWRDREIAISPAQEGPATFRLCETCTPSIVIRPVEVRAKDARLTLDGHREAATILLNGPITLAAHGETLILRNPLRISARSGQLVLTVTLPVETYVERVVASESGSADSPESLKALAIVVRSFALHQLHGHADYDVCDSTHCQFLHWGGKPDSPQKLGAPSFPLLAAVRVGSHAATLATAGETLWFHGQRAEAWFHQNCGGRTASPQEVWPTTNARSDLAHNRMPWLPSRIDPFCTAGGAREWSADLALSDLTAALAKAGLARPGWSNITVARRGESGRAVMLLVDSTQISAEEFRLAVGRTLGWSKILSTWFEVSRQGDHLLFHGRGSGHGVGLCQAGAAAMSAQGLNSDRILGQYFPGAVAADESTGQPWQIFHGQGFVLETFNNTDAAYLSTLTQALAEAESSSGLQPTQSITVRAFASTPAFRDATLAPGWVAAFTEGNWIGAQPLSTLAGRKLLASTFRHEFLHALVEAQAAFGAPLWLREGLVEALSDEASFDKAHPEALPSNLKPDQIDHALAHATNEAQSQAAHRAAAWYAARLLNRFGRTQVMAWLRGGLPDSALVSLK